MIMASTQTQITFPVAIPRAAAREESIWLTVAARLLEAKLLQLLRFKAGDVYSVQVGGFFGAEAPSRQGAPPESLSLSPGRPCVELAPAIQNHSVIAPRGVLFLLRLLVFLGIYTCKGLCH